MNLSKIVDYTLIRHIKWWNNVVTEYCQTSLAQDVLFTFVTLIFSFLCSRSPLLCLPVTDHDALWRQQFPAISLPSFSLALPLFLSFYFVSAVLSSLLCSPFSSPFFFQNLLSKSLLSFSHLIILPFASSCSCLSAFMFPLVFFWSIHTWASEKL